MKFLKTEVNIVLGDITQCKTEAIVNAANNQFKMGGGVAGVIKKKGGKSIEEEAQKKGPVEKGAGIDQVKGRGLGHRIRRLEALTG